MVRKSRKDPDHVHCSCVADLESDLAHLKRELAAAARDDPLLRAKGRVKRTGSRGDRDWLDDLSSQDRKHMLRKLGWEK